MIPRNRATLITGSMEFSGSVERIQALPNPAVPSSSLARIEYSRKNGNAKNSYTASSVIDPTLQFGVPFVSIDLLRGEEILGPIARLKSSGSHSRFLIYHD